MIEHAPERPVRRSRYEFQANVALDRRTSQALDRLVEEERFASKSDAIRGLVHEALYLDESCGQAMHAIAERFGSLSHRVMRLAMQLGTTETLT